MPYLSFSLFEMGIIKRQSIKSSIVIYVGVIFGFVTQTILFPSYFTTEQVGLVAFILASVNIISAFVQFGMPNTIIRFRPQIKQQGSENRFIRYSLLVPSFFLVVVFSGLFLLSDWLIEGYFSNVAQLDFYYPLIGFLVFCLTFFGVWSAHSRSLLRIVIPNLLDKVITRTLLVLLMLLYLLNLVDFEEFMIGYVLIYVTILISIVIYVNKLNPVKMGGCEPPIGKPLIMKMLTFGGLSFLTVMGDQIINNIDVIMVTNMIDLNAAGIYKTTYYMGAIIAVPMNSLGQIVSPIYAEAWHKNDLNKINEVYKKSAINLSIIGLLLFVGVYINADNIFLMMPKNGEIYSVGRDVIVLIAFGKFFSMLLGINSQLIANSKYYYVNLISIVILAVLTIVTNYLFIPEYGIVGAAFASVLSLVVFNLIKLFFIGFQFKMYPFSVKTLVIIALGITLLGVNHLLPTLDNVFADSAYRSILITVILIVVVYFGKISDDVNAIINKVLARR